METFLDYYKVLQVHFDASPEIIKSAYKRLSTMYHPDSNTNPNEEHRMALINEAFRTLSNTENRIAYHKLWLRQLTNRDAYVEKEAELPVVKETPALSALDAIDAFFDALKMKHYEQAYWYLTEEDKENIPIADFIEWRQAIDECYKMLDYSIHFTRLIKNCKAGRTKYAEAAEFAITITDMDIVTLERNTDTVKKYAAFDGVSYKVCFLLTSVKQSTLQYRLMANRKNNYDPQELYRKAVMRLDAITGLYSQIGFEEEASREVARHMRYGNPFTLLGIRINSTKEAQTIRCICHMANIIRTELRINDIACRTDSNLLLCILVETKAVSAGYVKDKLQKCIKDTAPIPYKAQMELVEFEGFACLSDAVDLLLRRLS